MLFSFYWICFLCAWVVSVWVDVFLVCVFSCVAEIVRVVCSVLFLDGGIRFAVI